MTTQTIPNENLRKLVNDVTSIPTLPEVLTRVNILLNDPDARAKDVAKIISEDPALTFTLLKVVNSAYYGLPRKIVQIDHAISILGFSATYSLLMTTSILSSFSSKKMAAGFNFSKFWTHSLGVATASRFLANHFGMRAQAEDLYIAGLLHDVGKIIIQQNNTETFRKILEKTQKENIRSHDAELQVLGFSHEEVGSLLAARWNLPPKLVAIIPSHHAPFANEKYREFAKLSSIVHLADLMCKMIDLGHSGDDLVPPVDLQAWKSLDCDLGAIDKTLYQLREQKQNIESLSSDVAH